MRSAERSFGPSDSEKISKLIHGLVRYRFDPQKFREELLASALTLIPVKGPSSVFRLTNFFSEGGEYIDASHRNLPPGVRGELMRAAWEARMKSNESPIERALYRQFQEEFRRTNVRPTIGFGRLQELRLDEGWVTNWVFDMVKRFRILDIAYLWVWCAPGDLMALSMRKLKTEAPFSDYEMDLLKHFGHSLHGIRYDWYREKYYKLHKDMRGVLDELNLGNDWDVDLIERELTPKDLPIIRELCVNGKTAKEAATALGLSKKTVENRIASIKEALGVKKNSEVIPRLAGRLPAREDVNR